MSHWITLEIHKNFTFLYFNKYQTEIIPNLKNKNFFKKLQKKLIFCTLQKYHFASTGSETTFPAYGRQKQRRHDSELEVSLASHSDIAKLSLPKKKKKNLIK